MLFSTTVNREIIVFNGKQGRKGGKTQCLCVSLSFCLSHSGSRPANVTQDDIGLALPREFRKPLATSNHYSKRERERGRQREKEREREGQED